MYKTIILKVILLFLIKKEIGENFKLHSDTDITKYSLNSFPCFYKEWLSRWRKYISYPVSLLSTITSQVLLFNENMKVDGKCMYFIDFSKKKLNFMGQSSALEGKLKNWIAIKNEYSFFGSRSFHCVPPVYASKKPRKYSIKEQNTNLKGLRLYGYNLIKKTKFIYLANLIARNYIVFSF